MRTSLAPRTLSGGEPLRVALGSDAVVPSGETGLLSLFGAPLLRSAGTPLELESCPRLLARCGGVSLPVWLSPLCLMRSLDELSCTASAGVATELDMAGFLVVWPDRVADAVCEPSGRRLYILSLSVEGSSSMMMQAVGSSRQ